MKIMMSPVIMVIIFIVVNYLNGATFTLEKFKVKVNATMVVTKTKLAHTRSKTIFAN